MARRSEAARKRTQDKRSKLEAELKEAEDAVRDLLKSDESKLVKTKKQQMYRKCIRDLKQNLDLI